MKPKKYPNNSSILQSSKLIFFSISTSVAKIEINQLVLGTNIRVPQRCNLSHEVSRGDKRTSPKKAYEFWDQFGLHLSNINRDLAKNFPFGQKKPPGDKLAVVVALMIP